LNGLRSSKLVLDEYLSFIKAKNLGIVFTANDLSFEKLNLFSIIENKLNDLRTNKNGSSN